MSELEQARQKVIDIAKEIDSLIDEGYEICFVHDIASDLYYALKELRRLEEG